MPENFEVTELMNSTVRLKPVEESVYLRLAEISLQASAFHVSFLNYIILN